MAVVVSSPLAVLTAESGIVYTFSSIGFFDADKLIQPSWGVLTFAAVTALLCLVNIFLFKKRKVQIKMCYLSIILILSYYGTFAAYLFAAQTTLAAQFSRVGYGLALPVVALVLIVLALTKIKADERLVQSLNRIR